jgi:hypothetical protein
MVQMVWNEVRETEAVMTLFLILHKVRGAPALDIAEQIDDIWIIPTSGHRAYPLIVVRPVEITACGAGPEWDALPDHYQILESKPKKKDPDEDYKALRESLGIGPGYQMQKRSFT